VIAAGDGAVCEIAAVGAKVAKLAAAIPHKSSRENERGSSVRRRTVPGRLKIGRFPAGSLKTMALISGSPVTS
jgi:hypothetical protein